MNSQNSEKSFIVLVAFLLLTGLVSWKMYFKSYWQRDTVSIHAFPKEIDGWQAEELPVTDDEKAILETDNVFARRYTNRQGEDVVLFIVYSQNNRKVSHPPEVCYAGSGAAILNDERDSFPVGAGDQFVNVNRVLVEKGEYQQIFFYWFKVGDSFTPSYWRQQTLIAMKTFLGQPASSALIRISADIKNDNAAEAARRIKGFSRLIVPFLHQYLP